MKIIIFFTIVALFLINTVGGFAKNLYLRDYLNDNLKDVTPAVLQMLNDAQKYKSCKLIIEEGEYHFYPEKAFEKYCYISNHDNSLRRIAFPIIDYDNLEIVGRNVKLIFHGLIMPFLIEDSRNIKVSGISIDWELPLHSEAVVYSNNPENGTFDLKISNEYPYVIRNNDLIFIKEGGYEHDLHASILFDPLRKAVAYNNNKFMPLSLLSEVKINNKEILNSPNYINYRTPKYDLQNKESSTIATQIEPDIVRIKTTKPVPPIGLILICKGKGGNNRLSNAFHINKSSDIELNDVKIFHAGGMGVIAERSSNIMLEKVFVQTNPQKNRMVSTTADATHFANCKGKVTINQCVFTNMLDDGINVHGAYVVVEDILGAKKLGVRVGHHQQLGFTFAEKGDKIGFVNHCLSALPQFTSTVESIDVINEEYYVISFEDEISQCITKDFVLENLDWNPELIISNCSISNNRARGILLSTPKKIIVKNNYFSNMMSAILVPVELSWWYESGLVEDLIIRNNEFTDCCHGGNMQSVINIHSDLDKTDYTFGTIIIENNKFNHFDSAILHANGVRNLLFINNSIKNTETFPPLYPEFSAFEFRHIGSLKIKNNNFKNDLKKKIIIEDIRIKEINF